MKIISNCEFSFHCDTCSIRIIITEKRLRLSGPKISMLIVRLLLDLFVSIFRFIVSLFTFAVEDTNMIKRRFYRLEHGGRDEPSGSSSSSDSEVEPEATDESGEEDDEGNVVSKSRENGEASSSSGYETEDSSINEVNLDSSGIPTSDDDTLTQIGGENILASIPIGEGDNVLAGEEHTPEEEEETPIDLPDWVLKCKSVYKCRLCPRIVCLTEETLKAHLSSKRHARSDKLRKEGRLKLMLNGSGQLEGESDDPEAATISGRKSAERKKKGGKGQGKQKKRSRQESRFGKGRSKGRREKRRKNDD
ncbi:hypothetical protein ABFS82_08G068200 [Erythranthe guttata]